MGATIAGETSKTTCEQVAVVMCSSLNLTDDEVILESGVSDYSTNRRVVRWVDCCESSVMMRGAGGGRGGGGTYPIIRLASLVSMMIRY